MKSTNLYSRHLKRLVDVMGAVLLIALSAPIFLAVTFYMLIKEGTPLLHSGIRVGKGSNPFKMHKFRTMIIGAEQKGSYYTSANDQRITPTGRFLRSSSLDELPQLFNVVKGDMSLIGPRPDSLAQEKLYSVADWTKRCSVKPGITGLAQATLRNGGTTKERTSLDLQYVDNISFVGDLKILFMTARQVVFQRSF